MARTQRTYPLNATRSLVMEAIQACPKHFSPEDVIDILKRRRVRISRSTVYRTIEYFIQQGWVKRHWLDQNTFLYELMDEHHHDHMICIHCGRMIEFYRAAIERQQERICKKYRFQAVTHTMMLFGYCQECQGTGSENRS